MENKLEFLKKLLDDNIGKSLKMICRENNLDYKSTSAYLIRNGISNKNRESYTIPKDIVDKMYDEYKHGVAIYKLEKKYGYYQMTISKYFKKFGYIIEPKKVDVSINNFFFENIDTEEKAYLLGFFAADGTINKHGCGMALLIQAEDVEILDYYKRAFNDKKEYYYYPAKKYSHKDRLKIEINSYINKKILIEKGFPCRKTYNMFALPDTFTTKDLYRHFIRGYFDGDGSIILPSKKSRVTKFKITSSNVPFLKFCMKEFEEIGCYNIKIDYPDNNFAKSLYIQNKKSISILYHYLYDGSNFYLKRKYDKMKCVALSVGDN